MAMIFAKAYGAAEVGMIPQFVSLIYVLPYILRLYWF